MAKFVYGSLPRQLKQKGYLPGHITKAFGPRYVAAGIAKDGVAVEFGEFVELESQNSKGYVVNVVDASTALGTEAVIVRDVVGFDATGGGIVHAPKDNVTLSLFVPTEGNKGKIVAILGGGTPAVGGAVFLGLGTGATTAGVLYAAAQGAGGVDTLALTTWKFASTRFAPTTKSDAYAVEVEYVG
jgi:hypothetical protein